jgi:hypothetical protein
MTVQSCPLDFLRRGWCAIPIPPGEKGPKVPGWNSLRLSADDLSRHFGNGENVGVILGPPSGELVYIDLDCSEALLLSDIYLPATEAIFGRRRNLDPTGCLSLPRALFEVFKDPVSGDMLLELRAPRNGGGVRQTLLPPSGPRALCELLHRDRAAGRVVCGTR